MPDNEEKWSLVGSEIACLEEGCHFPALTTCEYCWAHLPDNEKEGLKDKIENLKEQRNGDLQKFILWGANLQKADLTHANLQGAHLIEANLQEAELLRANLQGAHLVEANLKEANLVEANLQGALLVYANLQGAYLRLANLQKANLRGVNLQKANIIGANLQKAELIRANLQGANLTGIIYKRASFIETDIRNVDWSKNPSLERHIKDQQWLHDFKQRAKESRKLRIWDYIWRETCDYGQSILKWIVCSTCLAIYFGILYDLLPIVDYEGSANTLLTPYYYSIVTFTTLGFGDVVPQNAYGEFVVALEVILGYVMLGGLISIFANKLARRS